MAIRIVGVDLPQNKRGEIALTYVYGIGRSSSAKILEKAGVDKDIKVKDWTDDQAAKIRQIITSEYKVEGDLRSEVQLNIKRLMDIGCYRGVRHRNGLPVRGQSTKNNARTRKGKKKTVAKSAENSIIKSIDIDDFEVVTYEKNFNAEVSKVIIDTMSKCESEGGFIISEIVAKSLPKNDKGTPVLQIEPLSNGLSQLSLNTDILSGKTLDKINQIFANSKLSIANTLEEAVWHESGHAKTIFGMRSEDVKKLYDELSKIHIEGISIIAYDDGAEALAELEVLRKCGVKVSKEWMQFYEKYIGRKY